MFAHRLLLCSLLLTGCASAPVSLPDNPVAAYREAIDLSGKISINYQKQGRADPVSVKFEWRQKPTRTDIALLSFFGDTVATIAVTPEAATLTQPKQAPRVARDINGLMEETLGYALPLAGMREWLQGHAGSFHASPRNNTVITPEGWKLVYVSWHDELAPVPKPKRIDIERVGAMAADALTIRIIVDA